MAFENGKKNWVSNTAAAEAKAAAEAAENGVDVPDGTDGAVTDEGANDATEVSGENVWPTCDESITCSDEFYLNKLACQCFAQNFCQDANCPDG